MKKHSKKVEEEMTVRELSVIFEEKVQELHSTIDQLAIATKHGFEDLGGELRTEIREVRQELRQDIEGLRSDMNDGFRDVRKDILYIHENFVRKDDLRKLNFGTV